MTQTWFITGTDTEIGKTWCSAALIHALQQNNSVAVMKPIASGCEKIADGLRNADALLLQATCKLTLPYDWINPYRFEPPIAPHLAAQQINTQIKLDKIIQIHQQLQNQADIIIIEGVGGWRVPIDDKHSLVDLVNALQAQVILVVGLRLGCINHALLTAEAIQRDGCQLKGWIANCLDEDYEVATTLETLQPRIYAPLLGVMPFQNRLNVALLAQNFTANLC